MRFKEISESELNKRYESVVEMMTNGIPFYKACKKLKISKDHFFNSISIENQNQIRVLRELQKPFKKYNLRDK